MMVQNEYQTGQYAPEMLLIERGEGVYLYDGDGKRYLDFTSGISVNSLGYGNNGLDEVIAEQSRKLIHISNLFATQPARELAEKLCTRSLRNPDGSVLASFSAVHFGNSGTEANEAALKYARLYHSRKGSPREKFLAFTNGFHGRSTGALAVTATEKYRKPFSPLMPGATFAPYNDARILRRLLSGRRGRKFAAVIVEPVQGEGGLFSMSDEFSAELNQLCAEQDIVLIADEVQSGLGRCGRLFASELTSLKPNILTLSKPLAGGIPLSATLISEEINSLLSIGDHGTTFGGGPLATAAANHVWDRVSEPKFLNQVLDRSEHLHSRLKQLRNDHPDLFENEPVRGKGLLCGLALRDSGVIPNLLNACRQAGLLVLRAGSNVLRLAPPLIIETRHIDEMMSCLDAAIQTIKKEL